MLPGDVVVYSGKAPGIGDLCVAVHKDYLVVRAHSEDEEGNLVLLPNDPRFPELTAEVLGSRESDRYARDRGRHPAG